MARNKNKLTTWCLLALACIPTPALAIHRHNGSSSVTSRPLRAGTNKPKAIEPPTPKFKTCPDKEAKPELDLNVLAGKQLSVYDDEELVIRTDVFMGGMYQARNFGGNGYWGTGFPAAGPFFEIDVNQTNHNGNVTEGWPLFNQRQTFATIAGFHDVQETTPRMNFPELAELGWESVISGIPFPFSFILSIGNSVLNATVDPSTISLYSKTLRLQDGLTQWKYVWHPQDTNVSMDIEWVAFVSRDNPNLGATQFRVTPRGGNVNATIVDLIDGRSAQRSYLTNKNMSSSIMPQIYVGVHPEGIPTVTGSIVSTVNVSNGYTNVSSLRMAQTEGDMTIGQEWDVQLIEGETASFQKFIGVASSDHFSSPAITAEAASMDAAKRGWDSVLTGHTRAWNKLMDRSLIADYRDPSTGKLPDDPIIKTLQAASVMDRYIILSNLLPEDGSGLNDAGVAPAGLFSDSYGGMIFWDQDLWIYPAILVTSPEYAVQIPNYRLKHYEQAKANAQRKYVKHGTNTSYDFDGEAALYSWTSGRFGNATATGPAKDYEYHSNTAIALSMLQNRRVTGNETSFKKKYWPAIRSVAHTMITLLQEDGNGWSIFNATDPDEYAASVDNGAYLLATISSILDQTIRLQAKYGENINETWVDMARNVNIPRSPVSDITKEFEGMVNNIVVKQADVALMTHPWHYTQDYTLDQKRKDVNYYTQKQNPDGPAMTFAINAIVENQIAEAGCSSFSYHLTGLIPYLRAPWFLMSEVPNDDVNGNGGVPPAFPFVTGHGGAAQIPIFGYLGLDLTRAILTISPSLPPQIKHLRVPDFYHQGARFSASMNSTHTVLTRLESKNTTVIHDRLANELVPVLVGASEGRRKTQVFQLAVNQSFAVENDMYWQKIVTSGNLAQCMPTASESDNVPGRWPGAATDGNPATKWQPLTMNKTSLVVNLTEVQPQVVKKLSFNWGLRPPHYVRVAFTNASDINSIADQRLDNASIISFTVEPNQPTLLFDEKEPTLHEGNSTIFSLENQTPVYTGGYAILEIEGCNGCGSLNSWTGGNGTMFNPQENTFGATVGEFEIIGVDGERIG